MLLKKRVLLKYLKKIFVPFPSLSLPQTHAATFENHIQLEGGVILKPPWLKYLTMPFKVSVLLFRTLFAV